MAHKKKTGKPTTIHTREELEAVLGEYAQAAIERARLGAELDARLNGVRDEFELHMADVELTLEALFADLEAWAVLHREEFVGRRSLELLHGALGFRTGNPTVRCVKGVKWEHVIDMLKVRKLASAYVRTIEEVNKDALLADREQLGAEALAEMGLRIEQTERFFVEPKLEG